MNDLKYAIRQLLKNPGFTAVAVITLALCIGANLTIFAVVDAILVRALPFREPDRLVTVFNSYPGAGAERSSASIPNYFDRRGGAIAAFESVSIYQDSSYIIGDAGAPRRVPGARVSPEFFATLGVPLAMGRAFTDGELPYGADEVAILTDEFWRSQFNADPNVLGRTFQSDGLSIEVIGVLPRGFRYLSSRAQVYRPASHAPEDRAPERRHSNNWQMIARLAPGVTLEAAQSQVDAFNVAQLADDPFREIARGSGYHTVVHPLREDHVRAVKPTLLLLQAGVLSLLLIGGVNLANLLLIRASGHAKELAVRQALGATRRHIARGVLTETALLALIGGMLGLSLGAFGIELIRALGTDQLPLGATVVFDSRLAVVSLVASIVVAGVLAVPVVWFNLRGPLAPVLQTESRGGTASHAAQRLRHGFIVAQVALAFVLLSSAGLLGFSLKHLLETDAGFRPENVLTGRIVLPWKNYPDGPARVAFVNRLLPALETLPGISHAALSTGQPFTGTEGDSALTLEGRAPDPGESVRVHYLSAVVGEYWRTMGIPLIEGRLLVDADNRPEARVCVIDQAVANDYWAGESPLGKRISTEVPFDKENAYTIVGIVGSVKQKELSETGGHGAIYLPYANNASSGFTVVVRTTMEPTSIASVVRQTVLRLDPELPVDDLKTMQARIDESLVARRSPAILAGIFAAVALLLAAIGTYGVLACAVSQRRGEIGVRMALGALPGQIGRQFLGLGLRLLLVGTLLGTGGAWAAGRAMRGILFNVPSFPLATLAGTALVMAAVTLTASWLPAVRASRVDPMDALRDE